jgi:hypothetical protein
MLKRWLYSALFCGILLCRIVNASAGTQSLFIEVRSAAGAAIRNVCITVVPSKGDPLFYKTDSHGRLKVENLTEGKYRVVARADGFVAEKREITMGVDGSTVEFNLRPKGGR